MEKEDSSLLPGIKPVLELLQENPSKIDSVFCRKGLHSQEYLAIQELCRKNNIHYTLLENVALDRLCHSTSSKPVKHQGIVARLSSCTLCSLEQLLQEGKTSPLPMIVALDQVKDPGNLGTIARTIYALGGAGLLLPEHNSAYLGPGALRSSAGALEKLSICKAVNLGTALDEAELQGFTIYGAGHSRTQEAQINPFENAPEFPAVLVLGSEEKGLRPGVAKRCSRWVEIPFLRKFDSLNVAQAGGILIGLAAAAKSKKG